MAGQSAGAEGAAMRFEATIHAASEAAELDAVDALDLDRVPDVEGGVRVLVGPDEVRRLVTEGFEVRVQAVSPVTPLDPGLVSDDAEVRAWFEDMTRDARGEG